MQIKSISILYVLFAATSALKYQYDGDGTYLTPRDNELYPTHMTARDIMPREHLDLVTREVESRIMARALGHRAPLAKRLILPTAAEHVKQAYDHGQAEKEHREKAEHLRTSNPKAAEAHEAAAKLHKAAKDLHTAASEHPDHAQLGLSSLSVSKSAHEAFAHANSLGH